MSELVVDRAEVIVVGPPVPQARWADDLPPQYATHTILRLSTSDGVEGVAGAASYTGHGWSTAVAETLRTMLSEVPGLSALDRERLWPRMRERTLPVPPQAHSLIDIALWDIAARAAGLPLHRFLGGQASSIPAYASMPLLPSIGAFLEAVARFADEGYPAVKVHGWCRAAEDLALARALRSAVGATRPKLMLDAEQRYTRGEALSVGRELGDLGFSWFEAPLSDFDLAGYAELRSQIGVPIMSSGNWIVDEDLVRLAIEMGAWSRLRLDVTTCGGITPARRIAAIAAEHGLPVEIQSWGYTLAQAANLAVMLATGNCTYFEQAVPVEPYEHGTANPIRIDASGHVHAPHGPGLGIEVDWDAVNRDAILRFEVRDRD